VAPESGSHAPASGDTLVLTDGRLFTLTNVENGVRGWWFSAMAWDGTCTLHGNMRLEWDAQANVWRPAGAREAVPAVVAASRSRVARRRSEPRHPQLE